MTHLMHYRELRRGRRPAAGVMGARTVIARAKALPAPAEPASPSDIQYVAEMHGVEPAVAAAMLRLGIADDEHAVT